MLPFLTFYLVGAIMLFILAIVVYPTISERSRQAKFRRDAKLRKIESGK